MADVHRITPLHVNVTAPQPAGRCEGVPFRGGECPELPCATVTIGPLVACQTIAGTEPDGYRRLRLCPSHVTPLVEKTHAHMCCDLVPLHLEWYR